MSVNNNFAKLFAAKMDKIQEGQEGNEAAKTAKDTKKELPKLKREDPTGDLTDQMCMLSNYNAITGMNLATSAGITYISTSNSNKIKESFNEMGENIVTGDSVMLYNNNYKVEDLGNNTYSIATQNGNTVRVLQKNESGSFEYVAMYTVKNQSDGSQTITLHNPKNGKSFENIAIMVPVGGNIEFNGEENIFKVSSAGVETTYETNGVMISERQVSSPATTVELPVQNGNKIIFGDTTIEIPKGYESVIMQDGSVIMSKISDDTSIVLSYSNDLKSYTKNVFKKNEDGSLNIQQTGYENGIRKYMTTLNSDGSMSGIEYSEDGSYAVKQTKIAADGSANVRLYDNQKCIKSTPYADTFENNLTLKFDGNDIKLNDLEKMSTTLNLQAIDSISYNSEGALTFNGQVIENNTIMLGNKTFQVSVEDDVCLIKNENTTKIMFESLDGSFVNNGYYTETTSNGITTAQFYNAAGLQMNKAIEYREGSQLSIGSDGLIIAQKEENGKIYGDTFDDLGNPLTKYEKNNRDGSYTFESYNSGILTYTKTMDSHRNISEYKYDFGGNTTSHTVINADNSILYEKYENGVISQKTEIDANDKATVYSYNTSGTQVISTNIILDALDELKIQFGGNQITPTELRDCTSRDRTVVMLNKNGANAEETGTFFQMQTWEMDATLQYNFSDSEMGILMEAFSALADLEWSQTTCIQLADLMYRKCCDSTPGFSNLCNDISKQLNQQLYYDPLIGEPYQTLTVQKQLLLKANLLQMVLLAAENGNCSPKLTQKLPLFKQAVDRTYKYADEQMADLNTHPGVMRLPRWQTFIDNHSEPVRWDQNADGSEYIEKNIIFSVDLKEAFYASSIDGRMHLRANEADIHRAAKRAYLRNIGWDKKERMDGEFDGDFKQGDRLKQGQWGDCYLISTLNSLNSTEEGHKLLKNLIKKNDDGSVTVKFPSGNEITISREDIEKAIESGFGDPDLIAIELAVQQEIERLRAAGLQDGGPSSNDGGNMSKVIQAILGTEIDESHYNRGSNSLRWLGGAAMIGGGVMITVGSGGLASGAGAVGVLGGIAILEGNEQIDKPPTEKDFTVPKKTAATWSPTTNNGKWEPYGGQEGWQTLVPGCITDNEGHKIIATEDENGNQIQDGKGHVQILYPHEYELVKIDDAGWVWLRNPHNPNRIIRLPYETAAEITDSITKFPIPEQQQPSTPIVPI